MADYHVGAGEITGKIVAAADYLDHLISIGIDVTDFENEVITT